MPEGVKEKECWEDVLVDSSEFWLNSSGCEIFKVVNHANHESLISEDSDDNYAYTTISFSEYYDLVNDDMRGYLDNDRIRLVVLASEVISNTLDWYSRSDLPVRKGDLIIRKPILDYSGLPIRSRSLQFPKGFDNINFLMILDDVSLSKPNLFTLSYVERGDCEEWEWEECYRYRSSTKSFIVQFTEINTNISDYLSRGVRKKSNKF